MKRDLVSSAIGIVILTLLLGVLYPLVVTGVSQVAFPGNANGQKIYLRGKVVGSKEIGQNFGTVVIGRNGKPEMQNGNPVTAPDPAYFQTRPSATIPSDNAAATTFSNLGPNSRATLTAIESNVRAYVALNGKYYPGGLTAAKIPVDAANSSASGVDPDISVANADIQAYRISAVRRLPIRDVRALIAKYTGGRGLGFSGESGVNVLELNLALDQLSGGA